MIFGCIVIWWVFASFTAIKLTAPIAHLQWVSIRSINWYNLENCNSLFKWLLVNEGFVWYKLLFFFAWLLECWWCWVCLIFGLAWQRPFWPCVVAVPSSDAASMVQVFGQVFHPCTWNRRWLTNQNWDNRFHLGLEKHQTISSLITPSNQDKTQSKPIKDETWDKTPETAVYWSSLYFTVIQSSLYFTADIKVCFSEHQRISHSKDYTLTDLYSSVSEY